MLIYIFDEKTHEYLYSQEAYIDPEETKIQGKNIYSLPINATFEAPPEESGRTKAVYNNGWKLIADYRGSYVVNPDMTPIKQNELGEIPQGYILITKEQADKISEDKLYYIISNKKLIKNPEYENIIKQQETERIGNLSMTRGDVFEALILAKGKTKADLRMMIESYPNLTDLERALYLNRFDEALEFYRKHPAIDLIGGLLGITPEKMNRFFETKDWHELC